MRIELNMTSVVKVTRKGQTTIPVEVRQKLVIKEGDKLLVEATEHGQVIFTPIRKIGRLRRHLLKICKA